MLEFVEHTLPIIHDRRANPRDDLTTFLIDSELEGRPLGHDHVIGTMALLLIAGLAFAIAAGVAAVLLLVTLLATRPSARTSQAPADTALLVH